MPRQAFFLPASAGQRLCVLHTPPAGVAPRGQMLYLHPWAEEMNKARRMAALQSAALADAGWRVLQVDLHGCGDSSDTWAEASWQGWVDDATRAARWLLLPGLQPALDTGLGRVSGVQASPTEPALPLWFWGLRAGALVACAAATALQQGPGPRVPCHFLFWQPATAGRPVLQQFLRLKAAAAGLGGADAAGAAEATGAAGAKAAIEAARRGLAAGQVQHIAGYPLSPALAQGLEAASLTPPPGAAQVLWLEVSNRPEATLLPASAQAVQSWQAAGHRVHTQVVPGPAFWQTQEIEDAPALLAATTGALVAWDQGPGQPAAPAATAAPSEPFGSAPQEHAG